MTLPTDIRSHVAAAKFHAIWKGEGKWGEDGGATIRPLHSYFIFRKTGSTFFTASRRRSTGDFSGFSKSLYSF